MNQPNRALTDHERRLVRWILEHGGPKAAAFLNQLELAEVTPWTCECGGASLSFQIRGYPEAPPGVRPVADFVFGEGDAMAGIFVFENEGILSSLEVYGLAGEAPARLPDPTELRPPSDSQATA
jgi:hypothetical protein